jgi:hypothetical protein
VYDHLRAALATTGTMEFPPKSSTEVPKQHLKTYSCRVRRKCQRLRSNGSIGSGPSCSLTSLLKPPHAGHSRLSPIVRQDLSADQVLGALAARALATAGHTVYVSMRETKGRMRPQLKEVEKYADERQLIFARSNCIFPQYFMVRNWLCEYGLSLDV